MEEHSRNVNGIRDALVSLERRTDARFDGVDRRLDGVERRFNVMDVKIDLTRDALDQKMSRHFLQTRLLGPERAAVSHRLT